MLLKWQPFLCPNYVHSLSLYYYTFLIMAALSEVYFVLKQHSFKLFFFSPPPFPKAPRINCSTNVSSFRPDQPNLKQYAQPH